MAMVVLWLVFIRKREQSIEGPSVAEQQRPKGVADDEVILQMKQMLKYFSGNMNALEGLVEDCNPVEGDVIFNNLQQTIGVHGSESLIRWFSQFESDRKTWEAALYSEKARQLLSLLMQCGIKKRVEHGIMWSKQAELSYRKIGETEYGQECVILDPCWELEGHVFEKGIVKKV